MSMGWQVWTCKKCGESHGAYSTSELAAAFAVHDSRCDWGRND